MHSKAERYLSKADPKLAAVIRAAGPCALKPRRRSPFESLVRSVTYQQLNGTAAETILKRFINLYESRFPSPEDILRTADEDMRKCGLSGAKTAAIKDIAHKSIAGIVPSTPQIRKLADEEIVERLTQVRGVGPWTVEMLLIFTLGRVDVWPATDYGIRQGVAMVHGLRELPKPRELFAMGEIYRPYRSVAAWYFWRALDNK
jgi:DNA-3-methyladenine glycosylase II